MATDTTLPIDKLSAWYFAVTWGRYYIEQAIQDKTKHGWNADYDTFQLEQITDLEQFLKMTWDRHMEDLCGHPIQTMEEVTRGDS